MTTAWIVVIVAAVLWIAAAVLAGLLIGGAIRVRNRQAPHDDEDEQ